MKINISFLALAGCLVFTACNTKKDASACRVKTETSSRGSILSYFYNPDKNLTYTLNNMGVKTTYNKEGNMIKEVIVDSLRGQSVNSTIYLSAKGYVDSSSAVTPGGIYNNIYNHNSDGNIIGAKEMMNGRTVNNSTSVFKDGNQVEASVLDTAGTVQLKVYFGYYSDKPYSLRNENYGRTFFGIDSKNPIKNVVQVRPTCDTLRVFNFRYNYDDKGRISSKIVSDKAGMVLDSTSVTYY